MTIINERDDRVLKSNCTCRTTTTRQFLGRLFLVSVAHVVSSVAAAKLAKRADAWATAPSATADQSDGGR